MNQLLRRLEAVLERALWGSRLVLMVAVICSLLMGFAMLYMATLDVIRLLGLLAPYADFSLSAGVRDDLRTETITNIIKAVDGYLIAGILLIFAWGLYDLFISKLDIVEDSKATPRLLRFTSLDDLKDRVAKLIVLVLVIEFLKHALRLPYTSAQDLLYLALSLLFVGVVLYLSGYKAARGE